jgi:agmatinase
MIDPNLGQTPVNATQVPRFAGPQTFARLPQLGDGDHDVAILGAPFDGGTSYRPGARFGPIGVRQASRHLRPAFHVEHDMNPFDRTRVVDAGDVPCTPYDTRAAMDQVYHAARELQGADGKRLLAIGGDHTIALPMLRAAKAAHGSVALIHFDAHLDTWDSYFGETLTHGTALRRAFEEDLLAPDKSIHVGIRGPIYHRSDISGDEAVGFRTIRSSQLDVMGVEHAIELVRGRVGDCPVYLSVDIDVLDPAFAPGTGTPEMGGMNSSQLLRFIRGLAGLPLIGGDVVEVAPAYDYAEVTTLAAATLIFEMVALVAAAESPETGRASRAAGVASGRHLPAPALS